MSRAFEETRHFPMEHSWQGEGTLKDMATCGSSLQDSYGRAVVLTVPAHEPELGHSCVCSDLEFFSFFPGPVG